MIKVGTTVKIDGHVVERSTAQRIPGLRVEVWDRDLLYDVCLGTSVTNDQGDFLVKFSEKDFSDLFLDEHLHLYFKVFDGDHLLRDTVHSTVWKEVQTGTNEITIRVGAL
jgi:hypothetical protein